MKEKYSTSTTDTLGTRLKSYEESFETQIDPSQHMIIRLDGHKFSKFAKGFKKPFDKILSDAMIRTTVDLVEEFQAYTGYTQSDEITLVIPSLKDVTVDNRKSYKHKTQKRVRKEWEHISKGRVQKIVSLASGFATMRFNKHLDNLILEFYSENVGDFNIQDKREYWQLIRNEKVGNAWFDARIYGVDDEAEVFNSVMWRVRDADKNSKSMFSQAAVGHKELQGKNGKEQIAYVLEKTGKDWNKVENRFKYGTLVKKEQFEKITDDDELVTRSRIVIWSEHLTTFSKENVDMVMRKYR